MRAASRPAAPRTLALLGGLAAASLAACAGLAFLAFGQRDLGEAELQRLLADPGFRAEVADRLAAANAGIFDAHPDPDVARVLNPGLEDFAWSGRRIDSNGWGLRERDYELPRPDDLVRVVFVGDSYVFGFGVEVEERMGAFLERFLIERAGSEAPPIECLHLGVPSWDAVSGAEFVRRQLGDLRPDLVVHLVIASDLDDVAGTRGFGSMAAFNPRARYRTDALVEWIYPSRQSSPGNRNFLLEDVDAESGGRYAELVRRSERLARAVERTGGRYLLAPNWDRFAPKLNRRLGQRLRADELLWLPSEFRLDQELWLNASDSHWNPRGHELFARVVYGTILRRGLLPRLTLEPWPAAERLAEEVAGRGRAEAEAERPPAYWSAQRPVLDRLDFGPPTPQVLRHVYTGVDRDGFAAPYASVILRGSADADLRLRAGCLERPEIDGGRVTVHVEEHEVGAFQLSAGRELDLRFPVPAALEGRAYWNVRLESDDWVFTGPRRRNCRALRLRELAVVPR